jgi:exopolyphosphatase
MSATSLTQFLANSKENYLKDVRATPAQGSEWTVVMGNEAGDLDTLASSIAYAYFLATNAKTRSVPLLQMDRSDLSLRSENIYALSLAGITDPDNQLLFLSDIPPSPTAFPSHKFALVDHNKLGARYSSPSTIVTAILDHHADEKEHMSANPRIIAPAGSCSSHVTQYLASSVSSDNETRFDIPSELATLLMCAISIDTNALKPKGKALPVDYSAAFHLLPRSSLGSAVEGLLPPSLSESDLTTDQKEQIHAIPALQQLTSTLSSKKTDLSHLSTYDIIRRDYKEYTYEVLLSSSASEKADIKAGLATVPLPLQGEWSEDGRLLNSAEDWMTTRSISILGILTTFRKEKSGKDGKGKHHREMAWFVRSPSGSEADLDALSEKLFAGLETGSEELGGLKEHKQFEIELGRRSDLKVRVYKQKDADVTRKGVAPLLEKVLKS